MNLDELAPLLSKLAPTWQGQKHARIAAQSTGFASLDDALPGGGWPLGAITELVPTSIGIGEVRLILPALKALCDTQRHVAFVRPPFSPDPPALYRLGVPLPLTIWIAAQTDEDGLWAATHLLREASTGGVLLWSPRCSDRALRKLQLAAEAGQSLAFLFREPASLHAASPAALRLALRPAREALEVQIHKSRGGRPGVVLVRMPKIRI